MRMIKRKRLAARRKRQLKELRALYKQRVLMLGLFDHEAYNTMAKYVLQQQEMERGRMYEQEDIVYWPTVRVDRFFVHIGEKRREVAHRLMHEAMLRIQKGLEDDARSERKE